MWSKKFLLISWCFWVFLTLGTGVNGQIIIDSPMNVTYNVSLVDLNVSSENITENTWTYSLDGQANVTFTPNITLTGLSEGQHNITVFVENGTGNSTYGNGTYGSGNYGKSILFNVVHSDLVRFAILAKRFLLEIYIMFELMALALLIQAVRKDGVTIFALLSMVMFFSLAVLGASVEPLYDNTTIVSTGGVMFNYAMGIIAFIYVIVEMMRSLRTVEEKNVEDL